jgi:hypothetical protein
MRKHAIWSLSALLLCAGFAAAQTPGQERRDDRQDRRDDRRGVVPVQGTTVQPGTQVTQPATTGDSRQPQTHKAKSVIGSAVTIQGGVSIGTVDDIIFDDDGYIEYLVALNEGKYVVVPWQAARFNFEQRAATVNISQQQFQQVPSFTVQSWPTFDAAYRQRIYGYYGVTPGRERRIERRIERRSGP